MATECTEEAVLCFLTEKGGRAKHADFIEHFRSFIPATDAFRRCVDRVAVVSVENGEQYVCVKNREDGHPGPDRASVLGSILSSRVARDTGRGESHAPVQPDLSRRHALNISDEVKREIPHGSVCADAGAHTPPNISHAWISTGSSVSSACDLVAHKSEDKSEMGNQFARNVLSGLPQGSGVTQTTGKSAPAVIESTTDGGEFLRHASSPVHTDAQVSDRYPSGRTDQSRHPEELVKKAREEDAGGAESVVGTCGGLEEERPSGTASNTPRGSRRNLARRTTSNSPQVRRSVHALRQSRHAAKGDGDARAEDEVAAATLDPTEHEWMLRACDGEWDSLHRLLKSEPSLVRKKDFVTGFTCMHWAAKQGRHELLAQIVNFARQSGVELDVNARSGAGYTPLHMAAMHNHVEVIKLLVGACDADVEARDYSGKKPSQYLRADVARDVLDIAGADSARDPADEGGAPGDEAARWKLTRVLQSNLRLLNRSASEDDDRDCVGALARDRPLHRKSSFNRLKPRMSKGRAGITPIVHSTSHFDRLEGATGQTSGPVRTRPKSNLFG
ncbi:ankyrin repeat domain-containing protein SOWAHC [Silurus meridionalis]|nr:ankyrin repeat domain-containing protein SOWAHC [Silurus meridionalis]